MEEYNYIYTIEGIQGDAEIVKTVLALKDVELSDVEAVEFQVTQKKTITIKTRSGSRKKSSSRIIAYKSFYEMIASSLYICSNRELNRDEIEKIRKTIEEKIKKPINLLLIKPSQT